MTSSPLCFKSISKEIALSGEVIKDATKAPVKSGDNNSYDKLPTIIFYVRLP